MTTQATKAVLMALLIAVGFTIAPVAGVGASSDPPATYYGEIELDDGTPVEQDLEVAVFGDMNGDGERTQQDSLVADEGSFGGPQNFDDKLEIPEPDDGQVEFRVEGTIATIASVGGDEVNDETVAWGSGDQGEVILQVPEDILDGEPDFQVTITDAPDAVGEGDPVTVEAEIDNIGDRSSTQAIDLLVDGDETAVDSEELTLRAGA